MKQKYYYEYYDEEDKKWISKAEANAIVKGFDPSVKFRTIKQDAWEHFESTEGSPYSYGGVSMYRYPDSKATRKKKAFVNLKEQLDFYMAECSRLKAQLDQYDKALAA